MRGMFNSQPRQSTASQPSKMSIPSWRVSMMPLLLKGSVFVRNNLCHRFEANALHWYFSNLQTRHPKRLFSKSLLMDHASSNSLLLSQSSPSCTNNNHPETVPTNVLSSPPPTSRAPPIMSYNSSPPKPASSPTSPSSLPDQLQQYIRQQFL